LNFTGEPYNILADKVIPFMMLCKKIGIEEQAYCGVFPEILTGVAHDYFIYNVNPARSFKSMYLAMSEQFDNETNMAMYQAEWTNLSYTRFRNENPDKSPSEILESLIRKVQLLGRALGVPYNDDQSAYDALLNAVKGLDEFTPIMYLPKTTFRGLCNELRKCVIILSQRTAMKTIYPPPPQYLLDNQAYDQAYDPAYNPASSYYVDCKYTNHSSGHNNCNRPQSNFRGNTRGRGGYRQGSSLQRGGFRSSNGDRLQSSKRCFVCNKEGCWSFNYPWEERSKSMNQYVAGVEKLSKQTPSTDAVMLYIQSFEGSPEDMDNQDDDNEINVGYDEGNATVAYLQNAAYLHRATGVDTYLSNDANSLTGYEERLIEYDAAVYDKQPGEIAQQFVLEDRYLSTFQGELWDTGAAKFSTVGKPQLLACIRENPQTIVDWTPNTAQISSGGQGSRGLIGSVHITNPLGMVTYYVLDTNTPFLLSLQDADKLSAFFNNIDNVIVCKDGTTIPVIRKWGHPFFNVSQQEVVAYFTDSELRCLHRRFGHPRTERLYQMLHNAGHDVNQEALNAIQKVCHHCQKNDPAPRRFKFSIKDDTHSNYNIIVDVAQIDGKQCLHVIDADTRFQAAEFLKSSSAHDTWAALCKC
jgi:hypothetical protein